MRYKIYIIKTDDIANTTAFVESDLNWTHALDCFDSMELAYEIIRMYGDDHINYTILPHIYIKY